MSLHFFRNSLLALAAAAVLGGGIATARAEDKPLTKADVQQIIQEYIQEHPMEILKSVDDYQKKTMSNYQNDMLERNKDEIFDEAWSPEAGNPKGDVTIVEFFDYNCHYCKVAFPMIQALLEKDKNLRVVFKDFPILGPTSETAAKWALAADKQKKYFEFHKAMMENKAPLSDELLEKTARAVGIDVDKAKKDMAGTEVLLQLEKNRSLAGKLGLNGTPAFVIGDQIAPGALPVAEMEKRVAAARAKAAAKKDAPAPAPADKKDGK